MKAPSPVPGGLRKLRFGEFEFDPESGELRRGGRRVPLQPQPARVLSALAHRSGRVVTREELRHSVWGDGTHVDFDRGLNFAVNQVRVALGDSAAAPRFLETLPRRGYRFRAPVEAIGRERPPRLPFPPRSRRLLAVSAVSALAAVLVTGDARRPTLAPAEPTRVVLAVRPLGRLASGADPDYFAEGLTEELITRLGQRDPSRLGVIARSSVEGFAVASGRGLREMGAALGADLVLEGSLRESEGRVRLSARLVRVSDAVQVWAGSAERERREILETQGSLAGQIADGVAGAILPGVAAADATPRRIDPAAWDALLKGRFQQARQTEEALHRSVDYFEEAVDRAPGLAEAHARLAESWVLLASWGFERASEALPRAEREARRALELDPQSARAYLALGQALSFGRWRWSDGERALTRAADLAPGMAAAHHALARHHAAMGRFETAVTSFRRALELDPASPLVNEDGGYFYYYARRYGEALHQFRRTAELKPNAPVGLAIARCLFAMGREDEAMAAATEALLALGVNRLELDGVASSTGYRGLTRVLVAWEEARAGAGGRVDVNALYAGHALLGDADAAIRWLQRVVATGRGDRLPAAMRGEPLLDTLRGDPRFSAVLERLDSPRS